MRILFFLLMLAPAWPVHAAADDEALAVIVPADHADKGPRAQELALIFKRKKLLWEDGNRIQPVNLPADHPWRRMFSERVLKSLPEAQVQYWNGMYYHGVFPPHVVASPEAMLRFVAETRGAIGYVGACKVDARVRAVLWILPSGAVAEAPPTLDCEQTP